MKKIYSIGLFLGIICIAGNAYCAKMETLEERIERLERLERQNSGNNRKETVAVCILTPFNQRYIAVGRTLKKAKEKVEKVCQKGQTNSSIFCTQDKVYCEILPL